MKKRLYSGRGAASIRRALTGGLMVCLLSWLTACEFHTGDNGDLDGFWHLESMEDTRTGEVTYLGDQTVFWAYQVDLLFLQGASTGTFFVRFNHTGDTLILHDPYQDGGHSEEGDIPLTDPAPLLPYGITALEDTFRVERLDGSAMVLRSADYRLRFGKF